MTLSEYRQHLTVTLRECSVDDLVIGVLMQSVTLSELSRLAVQLCWDRGITPNEQAYTRPVRDYLRVLARDGKYVFDDEPGPLPSIHPEPWPASEPCGDNELSCDCGMCNHLKPPDPRPEDHECSHGAI